MTQPSVPSDGDGCNCQPGPLVETLGFGDFHEGQSHAPRAVAKAVVLGVLHRSAPHTQLRTWRTGEDLQNESTILTAAPRDGHRF